MKRLALICVVLLALPALASVNVTVALSDDAIVVTRWACERDTGKNCNNAATVEFLQNKIQEQLILLWRSQWKQQAQSKDASFCALFTAASPANQANYCAAIGTCVSGSPPQCQ